MEVVNGDNRRYKTCMQSSAQIVTVNKPTYSYYSSDVLSVVQPTLSVHWRNDTL